MTQPLVKGSPILSQTAEGSFAALVQQFCFAFQVESEFILENERESFIDQVREVIEMADENGEGIKEGFPQVYFDSTSSICDIQ